MHSFLKVIFFIAIALFTVQAAFAQKSWEKPWQEWKKEDALKILTASPWAYGYSTLEVSSGFNSLNKAGGNAPPVILRLYSSLTVRRALLRLKQINENYNGMNELQKSDFNKNNEYLLNCGECEKYYVLVLLQPVDNFSKSLVAFKFKDLKFDDLKNYVFLSNDKKEKRELTQYIAPKSDRDPAIFLFFRNDSNQQPLVTNETKKITFNIKTNIRNDAVQEKIDFDVSKMKIEEKVDF